MMSDIKEILFLLHYILINGSYTIVYIRIELTLMVNYCNYCFACKVNRSTNKRIAGVACPVLLQEGAARRLSLTNGVNKHVR